MQRKNIPSIRSLWMIKFHPTLPHSILYYPVDRDRSDNYCISEVPIDQGEGYIIYVIAYGFFIACFILLLHQHYLVSHLVGVFQRPFLMDRILNIATKFKFIHFSKIAIALAIRRYYNFGPSI